MEKTQLALEIAEKLLAFLGADPKFDLEENNGRIRVSAMVGEAGFLIGKEGENLRALQHIFQLMFIKKAKEPLGLGGLVLDINNYFKEKENYLQALAKNSAQRALETKKPVVLDPMPAFERRIIHLIVEGVDGVVSESSGEGEERRIVIKPKNS